MKAVMCWNNLHWDISRARLLEGSASACGKAHLCMAGMFCSPALRPRSLVQLYWHLEQHLTIPWASSSLVTPLGFCGFPNWEEEKKDDKKRSAGEEKKQTFKPSLKPSRKTEIKLMIPTNCTIYLLRGSWRKSSKLKSLNEVMSLKIGISCCKY